MQYGYGITSGSFILAIGVLITVLNIFYSKAKAKYLPPVGPDPWDARGLEWMVASPTPEHNFDEVPTVTRLDEFWHRKYGEDEDGRMVRQHATEDVAQKGDATGVHLPASYTEKRRTPRRQTDHHV